MDTDAPKHEPQPMTSSPQAARALTRVRKMVAFAIAKRGGHISGDESKAIMAALDYVLDAEGASDPHADEDVVVVAEG